MLRRPRRTFVCFMLVLPILLPCAPGNSSSYIEDNELVVGQQDMTTRRANTLFDDADDLQPQLDNEFKEKLSHLKTTWMWSTPSHFPFAIVHSTTPSVLIVSFKQINENARRRKSILSKRSITWKANQLHPYRTICNGLSKLQKLKSPFAKCSGRRCGSSRGKHDEHDRSAINTGTYSHGNDSRTDRNHSSPLSIKISDVPSKPPDGSINCDCKCPCNISICEPKIYWDFGNQLKWHEEFKDCNGRRQSPIDLSQTCLHHGRGYQDLAFVHYRVVPKNLTFTNDGKRVFIQGWWDKKEWPLVYGGALFGRKYLFHSMSFYWPSEHTIGGFNFPMESQLLHIAAEYQSYEEAVAASAYDPHAFLGIVNIYKYGNTRATGGLQAIYDFIDKDNTFGAHPFQPIPLANFSPPFLEYICYHGSLTIPPCTEAVFWIIRRRSLPITREEAAKGSKVARASSTQSNIFFRMIQPVNDRKMYTFFQNRKCKTPKT